MSNLQQCSWGLEKYSCTVTKAFDCEVSNHQIKTNLWNTFKNNSLPKCCTIQISHRCNNKNKETSLTDRWQLKCNSHTELNQGIKMSIETGFKNRQCRGQPNMQRQLIPKFAGYNCKGTVSFVLQPSSWDIQKQVVRTRSKWPWLDVLYMLGIGWKRSERHVGASPSTGFKANIILKSILKRTGSHWRKVITG